MEWKNIYRGMAMGTSDIVPGVSGGTIAVIIGFYDELIAAINGLFSREWKKHLQFLIPLAIGIGLAVFSFSHLMSWLLDHHEKVTFYFFLGLIIGILPYLFREVKTERKMEWYHFLLLLLGMAFMILLPESAKDNAVIEQMNFSSYMLLFAAGFLASAAMILPGISGSFILVVIGVYKTVIDALKTLNVTILFTVACGIGVGLIVMSKLIHYSLKHFRTATFSFIIGLVIGSVYVIFPGWSENYGQLIVSVIVFASGLLVAFILGKLEY